MAQTIAGTWAADSELINLTSLVKLESITHFLHEFQPPFFKTELPLTALGLCEIKEERGSCGMAEPRGGMLQESSGASAGLRPVLCVCTQTLIGMASPVHVCIVRL